MPEKPYQTETERLRSLKEKARGGGGRIHEGFTASSSFAVMFYRDSKVSRVILQIGSFAKAAFTGLPVRFCPERRAMWHCFRQLLTIP